MSRLLTPFFPRNANANYAHVVRQFSFQKQQVYCCYWLMQPIYSYSVYIYIEKKKKTDSIVIYPFFGRSQSYDRNRGRAHDRDAVCPTTKLMLCIQTVPMDSALPIGIVKSDTATRNRFCPV